MDVIALVVLIFLGLLLFYFSLRCYTEYKSKRKLELKVKSILLFFYGFLYYIILVVCFLYKSSLSHTLSFLALPFAVILSKLSYHFLYKYMKSKNRSNI